MAGDDHLLRRVVVDGFDHLAARGLGAGRLDIGIAQPQHGRHAALPIGHRIAHEKAIANANWWEKAKGDAFAKVASAGLWAIVVFLAIAAWEHIKQEARK